MPVIFELLIVVLAGLGLAIATYIRRHKLAGEKLVCPLDANCEAVVHSPWSSTLGIHNERLGQLYYLIVGLFYLLFIFYPAVLTPALSLILTIISAAAFSFSLYLIYIQVAKIKEWCVWCLFSAFCTISIFLATLGLWFVV